MKKLILIIVFVLLCAAKSLISQVSIYPPVVFIDPAKRTGSIEVKNTSMQPREIEFEFRFNYPIFDSLGLSTGISDSLAEMQHSLTDKIAVFPKKLIVPPGEKQTARFMIKNIGSLPDGSYWSKVIIRSNPIIEQIDTLQNDGKVKTNIIVKSEFSTIINYNKGEISSGADFENISVLNDTSGTILLFKDKLMGPTPFWGVMELIFQDKATGSKKYHRCNLAVYTDGVWRVPIAANTLSPGEYVTEMSVHYNRENVPDYIRKTFRPYKKTFDLTIN